MVDHALTLDGSGLPSPVDALLAEAALSAGHAAFGPARATQDVHARREGFRVGNLNLMVGYEDASELADMPVVSRLPLAPSWFIGMTNLHGSLLPVFDMASRWNTAHDETSAPMLLVLGHADQRAGLVIDGLPVRLRLVEHDRLEQAAMPAALADCAGEIYRVDGKDWIDVNCTALLERLQRELSQ